MSNTRSAWRSNPELKARVMPEIVNAYDSRIEMLSKSIAWTEVSIAEGAEISVEEIDRFNEQVEDLNTLIKNKKDLLRG